MREDRAEQHKQRVSPRISWWWITAILALMIVANYWLWRTASYASVRLEEGTQHSFPYHEYAALLSEFVDENGLVDYRGLKQNRSSLDDFSLSLERVGSDSYADWNREEQIALWINAYNALTLKVIVDHYPIESSFLASLHFPKNSIRQISGVWDKLLFSVMNERVTLDQIKHRILRQRFKEPRIRMALASAAMGSPPLRREPFIAARLYAQLDDQCRRFLGHPESLRIDKEKRLVFLSSTFESYGEDFLDTHATERKFSDDQGMERGDPWISLLTISRQAIVRIWRLGTMKSGYLEHDWSPK